MADSYALEMDDLHRRWLPKEILDDIGFADDAGAAPAPAAIEGLAAHLAGILGSGARKVAASAAPCRPPPTAAAAPASYHNQLHRLPVCGQVLVAYGGAAGWSFPPYSSPAQWQVAAGLVNGGGGGGALDHRRRLGSPTPKLRGGGGGGGTGVFLPRTYVYHAKEEAAAAAKPSSRDGKASKDLLVEEEQQEEVGQGEEEGSPATKLEQRCPLMTGTASSEVMRVRQNTAAALPELALPQEWTY